MTVKIRLIILITLTYLLTSEFNDADQTVRAFLFLSLIFLFALAAAHPLNDVNAHAFHAMLPLLPLKFLLLILRAACRNDVSNAANVHSHDAALQHDV